MIVDGNGGVDSLKRYSSVTVLIFANLVPILGVLFWGWDLRGILFLYWAESGVVGFYSVLKMLLVGDGSWIMARIAMALFFIFHFGIFMLVHGVFLLFFIDQKAMLGPLNALSFNWVSEYWVALFLLWLSHGYSFVTNYLIKGERRKATLQQLMTQPYSRIILTHFSVLFGGVLSVVGGGGWPVLAILVLLKTIADLNQHLKERGRPTIMPKPGQIFDIGFPLIVGLVVVGVIVIMAVAMIRILWP